jgi:coenzyme F420-dependent oxidoreductase
MLRERTAVALAPSKRVSLEGVTELAVLAERLGYESLWVPETWGADAATLLAAIAGRTDRIKIASGIFNVFSRSPALIAQTAATLQSLSGGRFILGLGTSGPIVVERWHGLPYRRPLARTRDYVNIIRLALSGARVDYEATDFRLSGFRLVNPPDVPVPIYVAALGPRNVRLTGEIADGWLPIFAARGRLAPLRAELHDGANASGRDPAQIDVASFVPAAIGPGGNDLLRQHLAYYVGAMGSFYAEHLTRLGFAEEVTRVRDSWQSGHRDHAAAAVDERVLSACTLGSDPTEARRRLAEYRSEGVNMPIVVLPSTASVSEYVDTLEALAPADPPL